MDTEKKAYEIGFMAKDEPGVHEVVDRIKHHGGEITLEGPVEQALLAYKIKKHAQAHFGYLHFLFEPANIAALTDELERAAGVLRFLIVTPPFMKPKPRPMLPEKGRSGLRAQPMMEKKPAPAVSLSNEALEKKIEEILQQS